MKTINIAKITLLLAIGFTFMLSCTREDMPGPGGGTGKVATVKLNQLSFSGNSLALEGENDIRDIQACLFQGGVMTKVFENPDGTDAGYRLQVDRLEGRLYMLANLSGVIDLGSMLQSRISEEDFFKTPVDMASDGKVVNFFTGMVELSGPDTYSYTANMERGVARFDLAVTTGSQPLSVKKIEITNVAGKGYLITPSEGISTPDIPEESAVSIDFDVPVADKSDGFLYVYEQKNSGMQVNVTVDVAGHEKVLAKEITGDISRNTVYTIRVNKDRIDICVSLEIADWEDGSDTDIDV